MKLTFEQENEKLCEQLLGWRREGVGWRLPSGEERVTPCFTTWADAGLILQALRSRQLSVHLQSSLSSWWCCKIEANGHWCATGPMSVRFGALGYLRHYESALKACMTPPDHEAELVCEKLLGWHRLDRDNRGQLWLMPATATRRECQAYTPTFGSWDDAGLILEAFARIHCERVPAPTVHRITVEWDTAKYPTLLLAIFATAVAYARELDLYAAGR